MIIHLGLQDWEIEISKNKLSNYKNIQQHFFSNLEQLDSSILRQVQILTVFIYHKLDSTLLEKMPNLRLICTRSTGFDHVDLDFCKARNIQVCNVPSYGENTVAEFTFALLLALVRKIPQVYNRIQNLNFNYQDLKGSDLHGKTLGLYGAGRIGLHVAKIAKGFGMRVLVYDIVRQSFLADLLGFEYVEVEELLAQSQILSLHLPYTEQTKHLINKTVLAKLPKGAILVNTARGGLVNNQDLLEALDSGQLAGAALDTVDYEKDLFLQEEAEKQIQLEQLEIAKKLVTHPKVIFSPHMAYYTQEAQERILDSTWDNIYSYLNGQAPANLLKL